MRARHVMLDIETLGVGHDAPIIQVGAVAFWPGREPDHVQDRSLHFSRNVCLVSTLLEGYMVEAGTLAWWRGQGDEARRSVCGDGAPLSEVMGRLRDWWERCAEPDATLWARGPHFDVSLVQGAMQRVGVTPPWRYNRVRDVRTLHWAAERLGWIPPERGLDHPTHVAVEDARWQAIEAVSAMSCVEGAREALTR